MIEFINLIYNLLKDLINGIIGIITFVKDLVLYIPDFLIGLPNEITTMLMTFTSIIIIIFVFKFIK